MKVKVYDVNKELQLEKDVTQENVNINLNYKTTTTENGQEGYFEGRFNLNNVSLEYEELDKLISLLIDMNISYFEFTDDEGNVVNKIASIYLNNIKTSFNINNKFYLNAVLKITKDLKTQFEEFLEL